MRQEKKKVLLFKNFFISLNEKKTASICLKYWIAVQKLSYPNLVLLATLKSSFVDALFPRPYRRGPSVCRGKCNCAGDGKNCFEVMVVGWHRRRWRRQWHWRHRRLRPQCISPLIQCSMVKRQQPTTNVKHSLKLLPRVGGFLDRTDNKALCMRPA